MDEKRIKCPQLLSRIMTAEEAAALVREGTTVAFSGFSATGYPKLVPAAIAARGEAKNLTVLAGASAGTEVDGALAKAGLIARRTPFNVNKDLRDSINNGTIAFSDIHLGDLPGQVRKGIWGKVDCAVIECCAVLEDGAIVPTLSVGASNTFVELADKVILELNLGHSEALLGMHDCFTVGELPNDNLLPVMSPATRVGSPAIPCDPAKIAAIVIADTQDQQPRFTPPDEVSSQIAGHIVELLRKEVEEGRLPKNITIQSGFGAVANAVLYGLNSDAFDQFDMYTEVIQDGALELLLSGKIREASATALSLSLEGRKKLYDNLESLRGKLVIRPQDISNNGAIARRLSVVAMNTAMEADIYGNVNSTHVMGSGMMNGLGGSGDFARHGGLSIFMTPATAKGGKISSIVPMVSHVDHTEHDVQIIVTEHGLADLRGKCPRERAELIIENCCDPAYRPALRAYYEEAKQVAQGQHTPHVLSKALSWHTRFMETGTMQE